MAQRLHIMDTPGSGRTRLSAALAKTLGCRHFDTNDFYWLPADPPFRNQTAHERAFEPVELSLGREGGSSCPAPSTAGATRRSLRASSWRRRHPSANADLKAGRANAAGTRRVDPLIPNQTTLGIPKMTRLVSYASGRRKGVATHEGLASTACQTYRFQAENSTARTLAKSNLSVPPNRVAR